MPSFDRLLVLAVLALSASVQSAPVAADTGYGVIPIEGGLVPAPGVDQGGVVPPAPSDDGDLVPAPSANDLDEQDISLDLDERSFDDEDEDEDDDDLEEDDEGLEVRDFDDEDTDTDEEDSEDALERRAAKKTTAASKAKTTKAAKPKTTKAAAPKTTKAKTTKAKTTKVKTTKAKTTAKATTTKAAKTTKVKTTTKPTKTAKATTKPAKTTTSKATSKASKTTKATGTATPSACPIKKPAKKPRAFGARAYDYVAHLFERDNEEFVGWHGTNSDTAAFWASKGHIEKPVKADGFLDFLGIGSGSSSAGTSGADAEIGPGLYVADNKDTGIVFANINAGRNKGTSPALCAVFARSSGNWRNFIRKAFIPEDLVGDSSDKTKAAALENARLAHIKTAVPGVTPASVVKFALFDRKKKSGQMVLPESIGSQFSAKCFKVEGDKVAADDLAASEVGTQSFPSFAYNGDALRGEWKIAAENAGSCS